MKTTELLTMGEMHHWKLQKRKREREEPSSYWEWNSLRGLGGQVMEREREERGGGSAEKEAQSMFLSSQLAAIN